MNPGSHAAMSVALAVLVPLCAACGKDSDRATADVCERAVRHTVYAPIPPGARDDISAGEQTIMRVSMKTSAARCRKEGLSQAQADCIFAVDDVDDLLRLGECPAIRDKQPSWLILPPPDLIDELEQRRQQRREDRTDPPREEAPGKPPDSAPDEPAVQ